MHNGWTNKATWQTQLWLSNDEPMYEAFRVMAKQEGKEFHEKVAELKDFVYEIVFPSNGPFDGGLKGDLLMNILADINFTELMKMQIEDIESN
jgi:hypothetical protein